MAPIPQMSGGNFEERHDDVFLFYGVTTRTSGYLWHKQYFPKHYHPKGAAWKKYFHFLMFHNVIYWRTHLLENGYDDEIKHTLVAKALQLVMSAQSFAQCTNHFG